MRNSRSHLRRSTTLVVLFGTALSAGCGLSTPRPLAWRWDRNAVDAIDGDDAQAADEPAVEPEDPAAPKTTPPTAADATPAAQTAAEKLPDELLASLGGQSWFQATARPDQAPPPHRWRHVGVEEALAQGQALQTALVEASRGNTATAVAAAVAIARMGNPAGISALTGAVGNYRLPLATRRAAAEALGEISDAAAAVELRQWCERFEAAAHEGAAIYAAELHTDLTRWLAEHATAADEPRLREALRSPAADVRQAAVSAWRQTAVGPLPIEAVDLRSDGSPAVRAAALEVIVARRPKEAFDLLGAALADQDVAVREAAVLGLGRLGDKAAGGPLKPLLQDPSERLRAAALTALALLGDDGAVLAAADNSSWLARGAAADALAHTITPEASTVLRRLVADASGHVRQRTVLALGQWPLEQAGPLLIDALENASYQTRRQAADELARRWAPAREFSVDAPPARREEMLQSLRQAWQAQYGRVQREALASAQPSATPGAAALDRRTAAELAAQLAEPPADAGSFVERLRQLSPEEWKTLEDTWAQTGQSLPEAVYRTVLTKVDEVYEQLEDLRTGDAMIQRGAARKLASAARKEKPLPGWAVERLAALLQSQTEEQVWRSALEATADDGRPAAVQLAALAVVQPSADVRRRGCEALDRFGDATHVRALTAALQDTHVAVALAAAKALGRPGLLRDPGQLTALLDAPDRQLRMMAARSLARGGWPQGPEALERLGHDADAKTRVQAAQALGDLADPTYVPALLRLADDAVADVRLAALANLPRAAGQDPTRHATGLTPHERLHHWKRWWAEQQAAATATN